MTPPFKLTDTTKVNDQGITLYQIEYTEDNSYRYHAGDLGGWVSSLHTNHGMPRICDQAYLGPTAEIFGQAYIRGDATVDSGQVYGGARVYGNAQVYGSTAKVHGDAIIAGNTVVLSGAEVSAGIHHGNMNIGRDAFISDPSDFLAVSNIGSENVDIAFARAKNAKGYILSVGCWDGTLDTLMEEVARRREYEWPLDTSTVRTEAIWDLWEAQYKAFIALAKAYLDLWRTKHEDY